MNPAKNSTYSEATMQPKARTTPAAIRNPRPSRGEKQQRCFTCEAYTECLDRACGFDQARKHWLRGFDCARCPSAAHLTEIDTADRRYSGVTMMEFATVIRDATIDEPMTATEIDGLLGNTSRGARKHLAALERLGMMSYRVDKETGAYLWTHVDNLC